MLQAGEGVGEDALGEVAVDDNGVAAACAPALEPVKGPAVQRLQPPALLREQLVREVAVEDDAGAGREQPQEGDAGAELVDKEAGGGEAAQLVGEEGDVQDQMHLAEDGADDGEAAEERGRDERVAANAHVEGSFARGQGQVSRLKLPCLCMSDGWLSGAAEAYRRGPRRSSAAGRSAT